MKLLLNTHKKIKSAILTASVVVSNALFAALPTTSNPSTNPAAGDYIGLLKGYAFDIFIVVGLVLGTLAFIVVSKNMIATYSEIGQGKKTFGDLGMHGGIGVLLLVFVIYLLTEAAVVIV
ncbi:MAG: TIGR03745 family integrating conjugative element membrane protein [Maribacter sp.]|nr:TIGR03745 family integrating conjugative element membrane protein [Maribacter sp.]